MSCMKKHGFKTMQWKGKQKQACYNKTQDVCPLRFHGDKHPCAFNSILSSSQYIRNSVLNYLTCLSDLKRQASPCFGVLEKMCRNQSVQMRVIKTVRLNMRYVEGLLLADPGLKVIYYGRDPRGIISSRLKTNVFVNRPLVDIDKESRLLCRQITQDNLIFNDLKARYPQRVFKLTYERLASRPHVTAQYLYRFLGKELPEEVSSWVLRTTHAQKDGNKYDLIRKNGAKTANAWKSHLTQQEIRNITVNCFETLDTGIE